MQVEVIETAAVAVDEPRPRADARDVVAPRLRRRDRRRVGKPEGSRLRDAQPILPEENRRELPRPRRIVASDTDHGVDRNGRNDLVDLRSERLLQPDEVRILLADDIEKHLAPRRPVILAVLRGAIADVEGHHREWLARRGLRGTGPAAAPPPAGRRERTYGRHWRSGVDVSSAHYDFTSGRRRSVDAVLLRVGTDASITERRDRVADRAPDIRNGLVLNMYPSRGGAWILAQTCAATERLTFREQLDGHFHVHFEGEEVAARLYIAAYGYRILVDAGLMAGNGKPLQFRGLCPLLLKPSERLTNAEVTWSWDGAGVEPMSDEPEDQIIVTAFVTGPVRWRKWSAWVLQRTDAPPHVPLPVASTSALTGLLVGVEYGADMPGTGRFVYCDAELQTSNADGLQDGAQ